MTIESNCRGVLDHPLSRMMTTVGNDGPRTVLLRLHLLASRIGGTLYIGVTNDLVRRVYEHKTKVVRGFTKKYGVASLVYYEQFSDVENAIKREKQLKKMESRVENSADRKDQPELV